MQQFCPALSCLKTVGGVCRRLAKWKMGRKRARLHLVSPDPLFSQKMEAIAIVRQQQKEHPDQVSVLYGDEFTFYRQPTLGVAFAEQSRQQPTVSYISYTGRANTKRRIVGVLDVATGQVILRTRKVMGVSALVAFLASLRKRYDCLHGLGHRVVLIWDNWPVHYHPRVVEAASKQGIELMYVPTYAPWTNPIEKFWDKLKDELLRLHRLSQDWPALCVRVEAFLGDHDQERPDRLRRVGLALSPNALPY